MKHLSLSIGISALLLAACSGTDVVITQPTDHSSSSSSIASISPSSQPVAVTSSKKTETASSAPASVRIKMSFATQAPLNNWDALHEEACEEASLILVDHYLSGKALDNNIMEQDIQKVIGWETANGYAVDVTMAQLGEVAKKVYGYSTEVISGSDVTVERIKSEIAKGNPVIVPLAGQDIGNPYFSGDGPPYHVLVIVGYDATHFITEDVGTRRGENYVYNQSVIMSALHDWVGSNETIRTGPKAILIVKK